MYLISIYFDDKTNKIIQGLINKVAKEIGNEYMVEAKVPPHITVSAFESDEEDKVIKSIESKIKDIKSGNLQWVSIGVFNSRVIFLSVLLNEYLHNLSQLLYEGISSISNVSFSRFYLPFQWLPHTTIAKKLSQEEILLAFKILNDNYNIFNGKAIKIGLSKTKPYNEIKTWNLE